jgi:lysophospholipase L1-like esterase
MRMATSFFLALLAWTTAQQLRADDEAPSIVVTKDDHVLCLGGELPLRNSPNRYNEMIALAFQANNGLRLRVGAYYASGNTLAHVQRSLDRTLQRKPTLVVLFTGTNDIRYDEKQKTRAARGAPPVAGPQAVPPLSPEQFTATLGDIVDRFTKAEARILLCTAAVIGECHDGSNPLDSMLDEYAELARKFAAEHKIALCDLRKEFIQYEKAHNPDNNASGILTSDGTMLNEAGHQFLAEVLMMHLGIEPTK